MERWEAIYKLFQYVPSWNKYQCKECAKQYKLERGIWAHIENEHNKEINDLRELNQA